MEGWPVGGGCGCIWGEVLRYMGRGVGVYGEGCGCIWGGVWVYMGRGVGIYGEGRRLLKGEVGIGGKGMAYEGRWAGWGGDS